MYQYSQLVHFMKHPNLVLLPSSIDIDLTNICNQDCYYCDSADFRKQSPTAQTLDNYLKLIDQLVDWKNYSKNLTGTVNTICFSGGGEPTLYKGFEQIIDYSITQGFRTSMTTNGTNLHKLIKSINSEKLKKIAWIGVDMDAGTEPLYEKIRATKNKSIFPQVVENIKNLTAAKVNVDLKILLNEHNCTNEALTDIFKLAKQLGVRMVYFRPIVLNHVAFNCNPYVGIINQLSKDYNILAKINLKKFQPRTYSRCHQMYSFLIFCSDGNTYSCCENKGNPLYSMGSWVEEDFRKLWYSRVHHNMYDGINTKLCPPCRSHNHNLAIEQVMQNQDLQDELFF